MMKLFIVIILYCSLTMAGNGSAGFRGGGDSIAADVKIIAIEWIQAQPDTEDSMALLSIFFKIKVITYFNESELAETDFESFPTNTFPVFINVKKWQSLRFSDKVKLVIEEMLILKSLTHPVHTDVSVEYRHFKAYACMDRNSTLCRKLRNKGAIQAPKTDIVSLAKHFFAKIKQSLAREDDVNVRAVVYKVTSTMNQITVYELTGPLKLDGVFVIAINDPRAKEIFVDRTKWNILDDEQKARLLVHEYVSISGFEDSDYTLTNALCKRL